MNRSKLVSRMALLAAVIGLSMGLAAPASASPAESVAAAAATCYSQNAGNNRAESVCGPNAVGVQHRVQIQCRQGNSTYTLNGPWVGGYSVSSKACNVYGTLISHSSSYSQTSSRLVL